MTAIDRRSVLGTAAIATIGLALMPSAAKSAPLTIGKDVRRNAEGLIENTQVPPPDAPGADDAGFAGRTGAVECVAGAECRRAYPHLDMGRAFVYPDLRPPPTTALEREETNVGHRGNYSDFHTGPGD